MSKILILINNDAGLYKFRRELIEELLRENEVSICLPNGEFVPMLKELGCKYIQMEFERRGKNPLDELKMVGRYRNVIRQEKPDIVLTYTIKPNIYGGIACQREKIPYFPNVTGLGTELQSGGLMQKVLLALYKKGLKKAACVFFQNSTNKSFFEEKGVLCTKSHLIPGSGVNTSFYEYQEYPDESDGMKLLFIGRIMRDKGVNELFGAMRRIKRNHPEISLDVLGAYDENYSEIIESLEQEGLLTYHGQQSDTLPYYRAASAIVLPTYHEGMSNVLQEAASCGRPVLASDIPGCKEIFDDGVTGIGYASRSEEELYKAIEKFIAMPYEARKQMGEKGRQKMKAEFSRQVVIDAYKEEIANVCVR